MGRMNKGDPAPASENDIPIDSRMLYWMLKLNADKIPFKVSNKDLNSMSQSDKRELICKIRRLLNTNTAYRIIKKRSDNIDN